MKLLFELGIGLCNLIVITVVGNLVSVHDGGGNFNGPHEVVIAITLFIGVLFHLLLCKASRIVGYSVVNGTSGSDGCLVWDKVEIVLVLGLAFNQASVDDCARSRVDHFALEFTEESSVDPFVNKDVQNLWFVL
jgi:hypothetical protein